jgi:hypothetical protein
MDPRRRGRRLLLAWAVIVGLVYALLALDVLSFGGPR